MTPTLAQALAPRWYSVMSPRWEECEDFGEGVIGPPEEMQDMLMVRATSHQRAKVLALRAWRRRVVGFYSPYSRRDGMPQMATALKKCRFHRTPDFLCEGENPFRGMSVKRATQDEIDYVLHGKEDECPPI